MLRPRRRIGWLWVGLAFGTVVNGLRLRNRLSKLQTLDSNRNDRPAAQDEDSFVVAHLSDVRVDEATRRAAVAHAKARGLEVLDLVPGDLPSGPALDLARVVDTTTYRSAPFAAGRSAAHAVLVQRDTWRRSRGGNDATVVDPTVPDSTVLDRPALVALTQRLKQYAARSTDLVVAPGLHATSPPPAERLAQLDALYGPFAPLAVAIPAARSALLVAGAVLSPGWGGAAAAAFVAQPYLVTSGGHLDRCRQGVPVLRDAYHRFAEPLPLIRAALSRRSGASSVTKDDPVEARRRAYTDALRQGTQRFFEPRRATCPWCGSTTLVERVRTGDLAQFKPGEFVIDECMSCGLRFQNPRLSVEGLDFYYRDFYDGLGEGGTEFLFAYSEPSYRGRVELACRHGSPRTWLDVGTGYGHFCLVARELLPDTRFDGLDMGTSVEDGQRRGWLDRGYRGLFADMAEELKGRYDLVSMHHYLEHTRDPRAELAAAHAVLEPGGHLLIEVPDPESRFARLLGRYWLPWFQPQHQEFLTVGILSAALNEEGFSVIEVERGPAHQPVDIGGAVWGWASSMTPPPRLPWRSDPTPAQRLKRWLTLGVMAPLAAVGVAIDRSLQPLIKTKAESWSNTYRLLARRDP